MRRKHLVGYVAAISLLTIGYQNCSDVSFKRESRPIEANTSTTNETFQPETLPPLPPPPAPPANPPAQIYASCSEILANDAQAADGVYSIDPDGTGAVAAFDVYCDMTTFGGGWTLVLRGHAEDMGPPSGVNYNPNDYNPNAVVDFRFSSLYWTLDGLSAGAASDRSHFSQIWSYTPSFSEIRFQLDDADDIEAVTYSGPLKNFVKPDGVIKVNYKPDRWGGRIYKDTGWQVSGTTYCNRFDDLGTDWGYGVGSVRDCDIYYTNIEYTMHGTTTSFWIR